IGWSQAKLRKEDVAYNNFSIAIGHDSLRADADVGRAGVLFKMNLYEDAIADAKTALSLNGTYLFAHDSNIRFTDLHFLIAEAYYHLTDYEHAKEKVNWLRDLFGLPAISWVSRPIVVDGVAYFIYQEALLKAIEGLRARV
ncbi:MAG: RagB/SusD family nutrient uptake outer membrane protein, partial [candidate division KSB1 bacterium]|nr:RagB/SusD family nutrient uptake outer membrane protein [candidate division KSB1 bacterium]